MRRQPLSTLNAFLATLLVAMMLVGCNFDIGGDDPDPPPEVQTTIIRIDIEPNPVAPGDSVQFTCVIEDSLDEGFNISWVISGFTTAFTEINILKIKAPTELGSYEGG